MSQQSLKGCTFNVYQEQDTLPDGTNIPAGAAIGISSCAMGRSAVTACGGGCF